jgi:hypothetical protein
MKEQSQIDAMRAAIRGDLERNRARQETAPTDETEPQPEPREPAQETPRPSFLASLFKRG